MPNANRMAGLKSFNHGTDISLTLANDVEGGAVGRGCDGYRESTGYGNR